LNQFAALTLLKDSSKSIKTVNWLSTL